MKRLFRIAVALEVLALAVALLLPVPPTWLLIALAGISVLAVFVALAALALDR